MTLFYSTLQIKDGCYNECVKNYHSIHLCMKNNLEAFKCMQLCVHVKAKLVFHRFLQ